MIRRIIHLVILIIALLLTSGAWATTYYIDWVAGNDANDGLSKATPWKRAPGMQGCLITDVNNNPCRARTHATTSGDSIILKGGVTWPKQALSWDWYFGNSTYFGVDQTWYTGAAWSRPILDLEGTEGTASPEGTKGIMRAYGNGHTVDNIELKRVAQLQGGSNGSAPSALQIGTSIASGGEVKNCYFHGWSHGGTATGDNMVLLMSALINEGPDMNLKIHDNVFDGSDTTKDMACAYRGSAGHFYNNYVGYLQNGIVATQFLYVWGNTFEEIATTADFDATAHHQSIEQNKGQSIFYNNLIKNSGGGGTILTYGIDGYKDYIFNNVIIGDGNQSLQLGTKNGTTVTLVTGVGYEMHVFNNTFQTTDVANTYPISGPVLTDAALMPLMAVRNNLLIGPQATVNFGAGVAASGKVESNNISMTNAEAASAGYVATGNCPYTPPAGGSTVGTGMNLSALAASTPSTATSDAASAAMRGTTCGVNYDTVNHRVLGPKIP